MKKILNVLFSLLILTSLFSCKKEETKNPADTTTADSTQTEKPEQKEPTAKEIGEAYGVVLAMSIQNSEMNMDIEAFKNSYNKAMKKELGPTDEQAAMLVLNSAFQHANERKKARVKKEGEDFLAKNAKRSEVVSLESGLQYEVIEEGTGATPEADSTCKLHYIGSFIDGKEFENSRKYDEGKPVDVNLTMVIPGWREGVTHMKVGGKYKLYIPYQLAYGEMGVHSPRGEEVIPPCAAIVFEIELLETQPNTKAEN